MNGKILKIASNDLYGNVDDRKVVVFASFIHKKYMNKYAIFTYENEYHLNKLYYASVHLKENSVVTFDIREEEINYINKFIELSLENKDYTKEYEIIDISNISKIELVSYHEETFDKLNELDKIFIKREDPKETIKNKNSYGILYFLLVVLILLLIGITYIYLNPHILDPKVKQLTCQKSSYNEKLELNYISNTELIFDKEDHLTKYHIIDTYKFDDLNKYKTFKENNEESKYFKIDGAYKYDDDNQTLKLIYDEKLIISEYEEVYKYIKQDGYTCQEGTNYE